MQISSKYRLNNLGLPVLSIQSGKQLISEVAKQSSTAAIYHGASFHRPNDGAPQKKRPTSAHIYQLSQNSLVQASESSKGTLFSAVA